MKTITSWSRLEPKDGTWEHNHISDGYDETKLVPTGDAHQTKSWAQGKWTGRKAYLGWHCTVVYADTWKGKLITLWNKICLEQV